MVSETDDEVLRDDPFILRDFEIGFQAEEGGRSIREMSPVQRTELFGMVGTVIDEVIERGLEARRQDGIGLVLAAREQAPGDYYLDQIEDTEALDHAFSDTLAMTANDVYHSLQERTGRNSSPAQRAFDKIAMLAQEHGFNARTLITIDGVDGIAVDDMSVFTENLIELRNAHLEGRVWVERPRFGASEFKEMTRVAYPLFVELDPHTDSPKPGLESRRKLWEWYQDLRSKIEYPEEPFYPSLDPPEEDF